MEGAGKWCKTLVYFVNTTRLTFNLCNFLSWWEMCLMRSFTRQIQARAYGSCCWRTAWFVSTGDKGDEFT